ncbi:unnamed protein product [Bursaphelenchus okinawaensis]|uniref:Uncharacterized protein n=1 Tax=Bursaphelenchus okinawaensis TaxID=465554 RepID=A0A811KQJ3_9BILA|nr:unnamed protein product [Bursaphelenchus okinawaensis]CAG9108066.1 unnamed protein product [Bursaphelenchus okinawaensis]
MKTQLACSKKAVGPRKKPAQLERRSRLPCDRSRAVENEAGCPATEAGLGRTKEPAGPTERPPKSGNAQPEFITTKKRPSRLASWPDEKNPAGPMKRSQLAFRKKKRAVPQMKSRR